MCSFPPHFVFSCTFFLDAHVEADSYTRSLGTYGGNNEGMVFDMYIYIYTCILSRASPLLPFKSEIRSWGKNWNVCNLCWSIASHNSTEGTARVSLLCIGSLGTLAKRPTARSERSRGCFRCRWCWWNLHIVGHWIGYVKCDSQIRQVTVSCQYSHIPTQLSIWAFWAHSKEQIQYPLWCPADIFKQ